jgi:hypothetical protein
MMHKGDNIRVKGIVIAIASILILSTAVMSVSADTAMIWTDKEDYSPGETVSIYGSGFNANAEITITIVQPNGTKDTITVNSDENGSFTAYYVIDNDDPVGLYTVTATDGTNTAITTFTDAINMSCTPNPVTLGNSVTCNATGIGNNDRPAHFEWYDASGTLQRNSGSGSCNSGNCSDTFTPNSTGTWTVKLVKDSNNSVRATATFQVNPPSDTTPPTITLTSRNPPANANGWNNTDVTLEWTIEDTGSGIDTSSLSSDCGTIQSQSGNIGGRPTQVVTSIIVSTEGINNLTCSAKDGAGNTGYSNTETVRIDKTPPTITASRSPLPNANGWNNTDVTVSFTCYDALSGIDVCPADVTLSSEGAGQSASGTAYDKAGNSATATESNINIDKTPPTITASRSPLPNANGWNNTDVTVSFTCYDALSGIDVCPADVTLSSEGAGQSASGTAYDKAGNSATATESNINIDKTPPTVNISGIINGQRFDFGDSLPSVTCDAEDNLSGIESCTITPATLPTSVGTHTITATAKDNAGNEASTSISYEIVAWTIKGFYQPVDNPPIVNVAKAGSTIPLKFEVFKTVSGEEITDTSKIVQPLKAQKISCNNINGLPTDEIELTATGGTSLRYDPIEGQFIYNWKTPSQKDTCWKVTVSTIDGSSISALFRLK